MPVTQISSTVELEQLVEQLLNPNRKRVVCVFTKPFFSDQVEYDYDGISAKTENLCDHYLISNSDLTRAMQDLMPEKTYVFGGAARVYPATFAIDPARYAPLRMNPNRSTLNQLSDDIESEIYKYASLAGSIAQFESKSVACQGTVEAVFAPSLAIVKLKNGERLSLRQEMTFPGIPVEWVFTKGQQLEGRCLIEEKLFLLDGAKISETDYLAAYPHGTVTLGLIRDTDRKQATIAVHPSLEYKLEKSEVTGNPYDRVDKYLVIGEVMPVRIYRDQQGRTRLRMDDIDDDEVVHPAPALVPGGLPWLEEERDLYSDNLEVELSDIDVVVNTEAISDAIDVLHAAVDESSDSVTAIGSPGVHATEEKLTKSENRSLSLLREAYSNVAKKLTTSLAQIEQVNKANAELKVELGAERKKNRDARANRTQEKAAARELRSKSKNDSRASTTFSRRERFDNDEDWMREEIRRVWIGRYTPDDRRKYPLDQSSFSFEPEFFELFTAQELAEEKARKAIRAILDLVTKRDSIEGLRESHALLKNGKPWTENGNVVMRMHLENRTPQAKRLTYWAMRDSKIKLVKVGNHDEYDI